jgi:hypothetical protein
MFPSWNDWHISYTRQGKLRRRRKAFLRSLIFLTLFSAALKLRWNGHKLTSLKTPVMAFIKKAIMGAAGALQTAGGAI